MKHRRPRKIITQAIVFLLLGAIVNVAVAWGISWRELSIPEMQVKALIPALLGIRPHEPDYLPPEGIVHYEIDEKTGSCLTVWWPTTYADGSRSGWSTVHVKTGWPLYCLQGFTPNELQTGRETFARKFMWLASLRDPIWPGFAINTIFYAAILWLLWAAPFALRRRRRIKRGLCPACAYPVGSSEVCSECGTALSCTKGQKPPTATRLEPNL